MAAGTSQRRALIRYCDLLRKEQGIAFSDALTELSKKAFKAGLAGKTVQQITTGGTTTSFMLLGQSDMSTSDVMAVCSTLMDAVDRITAASPGLTDDALVSALLAENRPIRRIGVRFI